MDKEVKKLWIAALRSGDYKQGREALIQYMNIVNLLGIPDEEQLKDASYCCLGVLCDVYRKQKGKNLWYNSSFDESSGILPRSVIEWAGLTSANPSVVLFNKDVSLRKTMAALNDDLKLTFEQIADLIEQNF